MDRREMHRQIVQLRRDFFKRSYPTNFKLLILALLEYTNSSTLECWPSQATLARIVGVSVRSIRRNLLAVEKLGLFTISRSKGKGSSIYTLCLTAKAWQADKAELVTQVVKQFTTSNCGFKLRTVQPPSQEANYGRERPLTTDAKLQPTTDGIRSSTSAKLLPKRSTVECALAHTPPHIPNEEVNLPQASPAWHIDTGVDSGCQPPSASEGSRPASPSSTPLNNPSLVSDERYEENPYRRDVWLAQGMTLAEAIELEELMASMASM